jgi:phospholipid/cholesterol/gamma-HCH transport system substrate-binding protein
MKIRKEFIVGVVASIAISGLILGFFFLKGEILWNNTQSYYAIFPKADGLTTSSKVSLNGVSVGSVTEVGLYPESPTQVLVRFEIKDTLVRIPLGSIAKLEADLLGTGFITLHYKDQETTFHDVGDTLSVGVQESLQGEIDKRIQPLMIKMNQLVGTADTAITVIQSIFSNNTDNLNESFDGLQRTIENFESISNELDSLMITMSASRYKISSILTNMNSITGNLKESNEKITSIVANVNDITDSLKQVDLAGVVDNAKKALENVNIILDEIQNGDGTLTKLMKDSTMYENMNIMIEEAGRLVENIQEHPNRYLQFAIFGGKDKGFLTSKDEKIVKKWVKDTLRGRMDK